MFTKLSDNMRLSKIAMAKCFVFFIDPRRIITHIIIHPITQFDDICAILPTENVFAYFGNIRNLLTGIKLNFTES